MPANRTSPSRKSAVSAVAITLALLVGAVRLLSGVASGDEAAKPTIRVPQSPEISLSDCLHDAGKDNEAVARCVAEFKTARDREDACRRDAFPADPQPGVSGAPTSDPLSDDPFADAPPLPGECDASSPFGPPAP